MVTAASITPTSQNLSSGGRLVTPDGTSLPLRHADLQAEACGGLARVVLTQRFSNPYDQPLLVSYKLAMPADGAVSGYRFRFGDKVVVGEIDKKKQARARFEQAIASGRTAALLEQDRSSVFHQEVGNIPPKSEIVAEVTIDQPLRWLPEGAWEWRFPTVVGPRYMGRPGRVSDAAKMQVDIAKKTPTQLTMGLLIGDSMEEGHRPSSVSHPIDAQIEAGQHIVRFSKDRGVALDRDVVVQWPATKSEVGLSLDAARPAGDGHQGHAYGLLTVVPPSAPESMTPVARDLVVLIDTSGSMGGRPLQQAARVVSAMIDSLSSRDRIELVEFSSYPRRWKNEPVVASKEGKREAIKWVRALRAGGGTEMRSGIIEAMRTLRAGAQRQILVVTDGYIGFEKEIVQTILKKMPSSCRLHTLGVGSSVNRSLTGPAARAGAGEELIIGLNEDAERAVARILKRTSLPLVTELKVEGEGVLGTVPVCLPDLFAESPALIGVRLNPEGGAIRVTGHQADEDFVHELQAPRLALGEGRQAVSALYGREWVEDLETQKAANEVGRFGGDIDQQIERIGLSFQIATRMTSWVAVDEEITVDADQLIRVQQPQALPEGLSIEGLGLRAPAQSRPMPMANQAPRMAPLRKVAESLESFADEDDDLLEAEETYAGAVESEDRRADVSMSLSQSYPLEMEPEEPTDAGQPRMEASAPIPRAPSAAGAPGKVRGMMAGRPSTAARRRAPAKEKSSMPRQQVAQASTPGEPMYSVAPGAQSPAKRPLPTWVLVFWALVLVLAVALGAIWYFKGDSMSSAPKAPAEKVEGANRTP